ncbi:MAG: penicillin-binding protein activator LpoB [Gammaproteobacteria bacterium]|nr:penicillin-binding protein activator LpoB [Gammaproteobacteria bacterium]
MFRLSFLVLALVMLTACSSLQSTKTDTKISKQYSWVLLPIVNHTDTSQASLKAEAILQALLASKGVTQLKIYPAEMNNDSLFQPNDRKSVDHAMTWAKSEGARYAITGSIEEWQYKVGIDGEPVVGLTLRVIDLSNQAVVWSSVGAKSGWSRSALSGVAQELIKELLASLPIE